MPRNPFAGKPNREMTYVKESPMLSTHLICLGLAGEPAETCSPKYGSLIKAPRDREKNVKKTLKTMQVYHGISCCLLRHEI